MYRVILVDDEEFVCKLLEKIIDWEKTNLELVGVASDGVTALNLLREQKPDIMISDIRMPGIDGLELARKAYDEKLVSSVIMISGHKEFEYARSAIRYGVDDYLLKPINKHEINRILSEIVAKLEEKTSAIEHENYINKKLEYSLQRVKEAYFVPIIEQKNAVENLTDFNSSCQTMFKKGYFKAVDIKLECTVSSNLKEDREYITFFNAKIFRKVKEEGKKNGVDVETYQYNDECFVFLNTENGDLIDKFSMEISRYLDGILDINSRCVYSIGSSEKFNDVQNLNKAILAARRGLYSRLSNGTGKHIVCEFETQEDEYNELQIDFNEFCGYLEVENLNNLRLWLDTNIRKFCSENYTDLTKLQLIERFMRSALKNIFDNIADDVSFDEHFVDDLVLRIYDKLSWERIIYYVEEVVMENIQHFLEIRKSQIIRPVREAKKYIAQHYSENLSLELIANNVHLNPVYFSVVFKNETGMNFSKYLQDYRINKAKDLLLNPQYSIAQVANMVGYTDNNHFSKLFKKVMKITPKEYRKFNS